MKRRSILKSLFGVALAVAVEVRLIAAPENLRYKGPIKWINRCEEIDAAFFSAEKTINKSIIERKAITSNPYWGKLKENKFPLNTGVKP